MECSICFENKNEFYFCKLCKESICTDCKKTWKKDCPYCRAKYIATMPDSNIETQPLLRIQERGQERRWAIDQIMCACIIGGMVTLWILYPT